MNNNLRRIDLNLLVVFDVLMQERSITRSAARLSMSQPTVSHALGRLRRHLNDPLLVRVGASMQASSRALRLHDELHGALAQIEHSLSPDPDFEPAAASRDFTIAATDYVEAILLPPLLRILQRQAPGIRLTIRHLPSQLPLDQIASGEIDLAIGRVESAPKRFRTSLLLTDDYLCAMATTHDCAGQPLSLARFAAQEHLLVSPEEKRRQIAGDLFPGMAAQPKIIANLPHFMVALSALRGSNFLLTGPRSLLLRFADPFDLSLVAPPFELPPFQISLVWHQINEADQGLMWLCRQLEGIAADQNG